MHVLLTGLLASLSTLPQGWGHCTPRSLYGAGSSFPKALYADAISAYTFARPEVTIAFASTSSGRATCRIMSWDARCDPTDTAEPLAVDFAGSDSPPTDEEHAAYPDLRMYPTLAGAVVPVYALPGVTDLVLSTTALAQIFRGNITAWDDPRITRDNADFATWGIPPGQPIHVIVRADRSGTTEIFKQVWGRL